MYIAFMRYVFYSVHAFHIYMFIYIPLTHSLICVAHNFVRMKFIKMPLP